MLSIIVFLCWSSQISLIDWKTPGQKVDFSKVNLFGGPVEIAHDLEGRLYICDVKENLITVISPEGEILYSFGGSGQGPGEFVTAYDLAVDGKAGKVWVADQYGWAILCFRTDGALLLHKKMAMQPFNIDLLSNGNLVMAGTGPTNLAIFDEKAELIRAFGRPAADPKDNKGTAKNLAMRHLSIATDEHDRVYCAYNRLPLIACYQPDGTLLWETERPWTNPDKGPIPLSGGGMAYQASRYHLTITVFENQVLVGTSEEEQAVIILDRETGTYKGFVPLEFRIRSFSTSGGALYALDSLEQGLYVYQGDSRAKTFFRSPDYEKRHLSSGKVRVSNAENAPKTCAESSGGCQCSSKKGSCSDGCCKK